MRTSIAPRLLLVVVLAGLCVSSRVAAAPAAGSSSPEDGGAVAAPLDPAAAQRPAGPGPPPRTPRVVVYVAQDASQCQPHQTPCLLSLEEALASGADEAIVLGDTVVGPRPHGDHLTIARDLLVRAASLDDVLATSGVGNDTASPAAAAAAAASKAMPSIDFSFAAAGATLGERVSVTFRGLVLKNLRKGSGLGIDFFLGLDGSALRFEHAARWRRVCINAASALEAALSYPRAAGVAGANVVRLGTVCAGGECYPDSLVYEDYGRRGGGTAAAAARCVVVESVSRTPPWGVLERQGCSVLAACVRACECCLPRRPQHQHTQTRNNNATHSAAQRSTSAPTAARPPSTRPATRCACSRRCASASRSCRRRAPRAAPRSSARSRRPTRGSRRCRAAAVARARARPARRRAARRRARACLRRAVRTRCGSGAAGAGGGRAAAAAAAATTAAQRATWRRAASAAGAPRPLFNTPPPDAPTRHAMHVLFRAAHRESPSKLFPLLSQPPPSPLRRHLPRDDHSPLLDMVQSGYKGGWRIVSNHAALAAAAAAAAAGNNGSPGAAGSPCGSAGVAGNGSSGNAGGAGGAAARDRITLGVLLGAGSFGRVYKGRWRGRDVAVKIMQHDAHTAARVANEVVRPLRPSLSLCSRALFVGVADCTVWRAHHPYPTCAPNTTVSSAHPDPLHHPPQTNRPARMHACRRS